MGEPKKKILIVEDQPGYSRVLVERLSAEGYLTIVAADGAEGLDLATREHPDLIISDLKMPKMDGVQFADSLRRDEWGKTAKVAVLTNVDSHSALDEVMGKDIHHYLVKTDLTIDGLVAKVKEMLA